MDVNTEVNCKKLFINIYLIIGLGGHLDALGEYALTFYGEM